MNCNLDLGLAMPLSLPAATEEEYSAAVGTSNYNSSSTTSRQLKQDDAVHAQKKEEQEGQQQLLTIFYEGRVCVSDVTELQAEAILRQARKEAELRRSDLITSPSSSSSSLWRNNMDTQNLIKTQLHSTTTVQFSNTSPTSSSSSSTSGVRALKRSLERFLEKRKNRIAAAASPY